MTRDDIIDRLRNLIEEQIEKKISGPDEQLDIDSFTMMLVITYCEDQFGVKLDVDQMDFDAFKSLSVFADLVIRTARLNGINLEPATVS